MLAHKMSHHRFILFAIASAMVLIFGCKPRQNRDGKLSSGSQSGEECSRIITDENQIALVNAVSKLASQTVSGGLSVESRNREVETLLAQYGKGDGAGAARAIIAQTSDMVVSGWLLGLVMNETQTLNESQLKALEALGVSRDLAGAYVSDVSNWLRPFVRVLQEQGFRYESSSGWSFTGEVYHVDALRKSPEVTSAFLTIFGPGVATALLKTDRNEAFFLDKSVFLPPNSKGEIAVWQKSHWESVVKRKLKIISDETPRFIKATKEAASYSNLMRGRIVEWFGVDRGHNGKTAPEIEAESAYKLILRTTEEFSRDLGAGPQMRNQMLALRRALLEIESAELEQGLQKLASAERAAIAAPFVPLVIWAAPYAGGVMGSAWATTIGNASATMALMPLAFAAGSATISAAIKSSVLGGSFLCNLYDDYTTKSADALFMAPFMAAMPAVGALGAGAVATVSGGAVCAGSAYGAFNLSLSVVSIKVMGEMGISGLTQCYGLALEAETAAKSNNGNLASAKLSKAMEACADAGLSLGFAAVQTGKLSKNAVQAIRDKNLKPLLGKNCLHLEGGDCGGAGKGIQEKQPPAGTKEIAPLTRDSGRLHQNVSVGERIDVIKKVPLEMTASSPGHDYLRKPDSVVAMGKEIAASNDKGLAMFRGKDKISINVYTDSQARVTGIEVTDGNHRFAAGMYAERLSPGKGWKTIGDIPPEFLDVRVNGFNTSGQKLPRWVPLHTVSQGSFPKGSWREIPPEWGAKGPTAEIAGDVGSTSSMFRPEHRGVSLLQVLSTSLQRIGVSLP